jgi:hypothetical protein
MNYFDENRRAAKTAATAEAARRTRRLITDGYLPPTVRAMVGIRSAEILAADLVKGRNVRDTLI